MHGSIAKHELVFAQSQINPADILDKAHDDRHPDEIPSDNEQRSYDLEPDLLAVAVNCAARVGQSERCASLGRCEEACEEPSQCAGDHVSVCDTQSVINVDGEELESSSGYVHAYPRNGTGAGLEVSVSLVCNSGWNGGLTSHDDSAPARHEAGCRCYCDQAGDHAVHSTNHRGFAEENDVHCHPGEQ
jgi:hypothetical protein